MRNEVILLLIASSWYTSLLTSIALRYSDKVIEKVERESVLLNASSMCLVMLEIPLLEGLPLDNST